MARELVKERIPWYFLIPSITLVEFLGNWWNFTNIFTFSTILEITVICYAALTPLLLICSYFVRILGVCALLFTKG